MCASCICLFVLYALLFVHFSLPLGVGDLLRVMTVHFQDFSINLFFIFYV